MEIKGRTVVITGASRGIGESCAQIFAAAGAKVIGIARNPQALEKSMAPLHGHAHPCDLSRAEHRENLVQSIIAAHGPIDIWINNAGVDQTALFENTTAQDIENIHQINLIAPIECCRQIIPHMQHRGQGHIVNVSSLASSGAFIGMTTYAATKAGLSQFHRVLQHEMQDSPIRMTLVEMGPIPTDMLTDVYSLAPTHASFKRFQNLGLMPEISKETVAKSILKAVEHEQKSICLPKRASLYPLLMSIPQTLVNWMTYGIPKR